MQHLMKQFTHRVKETILRALMLYTFLLSKAMLHQATAAAFPTWECFQKLELTAVTLAKLQADDNKLQWSGCPDTFNSRS